ncbi:MAG: hypothetical protein GY696_02185 [Gammaproteobacteria bacterium]|nr:hypothetical protein [Gammaproteobacteria bacterium]
MSLNSGSRGAVQAVKPPKGGGAGRVPSDLPAAPPGKKQKRQQMPSGGALTGIHQSDAFMQAKSDDPAATPSSDADSVGTTSSIHDMAHDLENVLRDEPDSNARNRRIAPIPSAQSKPPGKTQTGPSFPPIIVDGASADTTHIRLYKLLKEHLNGDTQFKIHPPRKMPRGGFRIHPANQHTNNLFKDHQGKWPPELLASLGPGTAINSPRRAEAADKLQPSGASLDSKCKLVIRGVSRALAGVSRGNPRRNHCKHRRTCGGQNLQPGGQAN